MRPAAKFWRAVLESVMIVAGVRLSVRASAIAAFSAGSGMGVRTVVESRELVVG